MKIKKGILLKICKELDEDEKNYTHNKVSEEELPLANEDISFNTELETQNDLTN